MRKYVILMISKNIIDSKSPENILLFILDIRGKMTQAKVVELPFYKRVRL